MTGEKTMHFASNVPGAAPNGRLVVCSPYDGGEVGSVDTLGVEGVERALAEASAVFASRDGWLSAGQRAAVLDRFAELIARDAERLIGIAIAEGGKPRRDTEAELARALDGVINCRECLRSESGREIPMRLNDASAHRMAFTLREPIGPVVAVSAFNHPLNLIVHQIGPAVASGCPVIVKPAEKTPLSAFALVELLIEAGLPASWCQVLMTDALATAEALVTDARVAFFSFIGSARVGWTLRSKLAPGVRCALEHGGAAPVVVAADADLDAMTPLLVRGGFYHAGQVCVSVQRVFAERAIARELAERLARAAEALTVGDPADAATEVGPLIRPEEVGRVGAWVDEAVAGGGACLAGGERVSAHCYRPTVLFEPSDASRVSREEIFGPVICVYPYDTLHEAVARANALPYAFQAAVMTTRIDTALYALEGLRAAAVMVNDHTAFRVDWMPFAGLDQSGHGTGGIPYTFRDMQIEKLCVFHSPALR
ncbi:MAG: aldehyde dehydrogenase family protein [Methylococcales bacterium]|nr:aldehyde dehydrogenase family protein [Methylococcales bacterium]